MKFAIAWGRASNNEVRYVLFVYVCFGFDGEPQLYRNDIRDSVVLSRAGHWYVHVGKRS